MKWKFFKNKMKICNKKIKYKLRSVKKQKKSFKPVNRAHKKNYKFLSLKMKVQKFSKKKKMKLF